jgi:sugar O-acyltransferase (sialic acid O-acetyltransferase NeuD family)
LKKRKLLIFGAGEAGREVFNSIIKDFNKVNLEFNWDVFGFVESNPELIGNLVFGIKVFSLEQVLNLNDNEEIFACCPLLKTEIRQRIVNDEILALNFKLANIIHPTVVISHTAILSNGLVLFPNVVIGDNALIGQGAIINYNSIIGHDVVINSNCFLGPSVTLTGRCIIGENVLMGAGSICIPGIEIGANSRIAAGIVVTTNINANTTLLLRQNIVKM